MHAYYVLLIFAARFAAALPFTPNGVCKTTVNRRHGNSPKMVTSDDHQYYSSILFADHKNLQLNY